MLRKLRVQNLMCLKDVTIELAPLLILVGPNGSGKSAIIRALQIFSTLMGAPVRGRTGDFRWGSTELDRLVWQADDSLAVIFEAWFDSSDSERPDYGLELKKVGLGWSVTREYLKIGQYEFDSDLSPLEFETQYFGRITWKPPYHASLSYLTFPHQRDPEAAKVVHWFYENRQRVGRTFRLRPAAIDISGLAYPDAEGKPPRLLDTGRGLAWHLRALSGGLQKESFEKIQKRLREWFPHIQAVNFQEERSGVRMAFTTARSQELVRAELESDGVVLSLLLLFRAFTAAPLDLLGVEGPEEGTHPYLLGERYAFLRELATEGVSGYPVRSMHTTHSIDFLNAVGREEAVDILRVVEFDPEKGTQIHQLKEIKDVEKLLEVYSHKLGDLWWSGGIPGVPSGRTTQG